MTQFQAEIEKLKFEEMDVKELVKEAAKIIIAIRDENKVRVLVYKQLNLLNITFVNT